MSPLMLAMSGGLGGLGAMGMLGGQNPMGSLPPGFLISPLGSLLGLFGKNKGKASASTTPTE